MSSEWEEEMEGSEEDEEEPSGGGSPASSSAPPSPRGTQKPPPSSTASSNSPSPPPSPDPFRRKTRDLPNIYDCHSCGLRFPDKGRSEWLQPLASEWRIVLLCKACLRAIQSAEVCSYCFVSFGEEKEGAISCRRCAVRVHVDCVPKQRGYSVASDLDPNLFMCVDCCAFPASPTKRPSDFGDPCDTRFSGGVSLEDMVKSAKCDAAKKMEFAARAKAKALAKAVAAKRAAELARDALGLVVVEEKAEPACTEANFTDKKVALRLHLAMNGSQRISRNSIPDNSNCSAGCKRERTHTNLVCEDSESGSCNISGKVELCTEDTLSETMRILDAKLFDVAGSSERGCHLQVHRRKGMDRKKVANKSPEEIAEWGEQDSCSDMRLDSTRDDSSINSVSEPHPGSNGPNMFPSTSQEREKCNKPDRYLKKYCKRRKENRKSASLLVPVSQ